VLVVTFEQQLGGRSFFFWQVAVLWRFGKSLENGIQAVVNGQAPLIGKINENRLSKTPTIIFE